MSGLGSGDDVELPKVGVGILECSVQDADPVPARSRPRDFSHVEVWLYGGDDCAPLGEGESRAAGARSCFEDEVAGSGCQDIGIELLGVTRSPSIVLFGYLTETEGSFCSDMVIHSDDASGQEPLRVPM